MRSSALSVAVVLLSARHLVHGQTYTDCNPLSSTSCPPDPALGTTLTTDFTQGASSDWSIVNGQISYGANGAEFVINAAGDAPTISSEKYIFFGEVTVTTRACAGGGMVSSFILQSDDLDEIDWEWLGSNDASVESNFFGKGNTTTYNRAIYHPVTDPIGTWHTYTIDWTSAYIKWYIDSNLVRTLLYTDPLALEGQNFPQTPMRVRMGNWVGCASQAAVTNPATEGTCQWAGGVADFSQAPFTMYVKTVTIQDYGCGSEYIYGDESGSWQSIETSGSCDGQAVSSGGVDPSSTPVSSSILSSVEPSSSSSVVVQSSTISTTTTSSSTISSSTTSLSTISSSTTSLSASSLGTTSSSSPSSTSTTSKLATTATTTATGSQSGSNSTTVSTTSSESSTKITGSSTSSSNAAQTSVSDATELKPKYKYDAPDLAVLALGLGVGYLII